MTTTYRLVHETRRDRRVLKSGLTKDRAEHLLRLSKRDPRYCLMYLVIEAEPATDTEFNQDARTARAIREVVADYDFAEHDGSLICSGPNGCYIVDPVGGTCSCPDWEHRASKVGGACKHLVAARRIAFEQGRDLHREAAALRQAEQAAALAAKRADDAAFARIFG